MITGIQTRVSSWKSNGTERIAFDTDGPGRKRYATAVGKARAEREALFRRHDMDFVNVRTDKPYVASLVAFFRARERRLRH